MNSKISKKIKILSTACLVLVVFVILWGAFVRVTHSGAGCGKHWPLCDGEIIVTNPGIDKAIEFTHRLTSGASLLLVLTAFIYIRRKSKSEVLLRAALFSFIFICLEALIGAGLVLFGWVKDNSSATRAVVIALHLINSFGLLFCLGVLCYAAFEHSNLQLTEKNLKVVFKKYSLLILLFVLVGCFGAITALGDTLFPSTSIINGIKDDLSIESHFLIKLRVLHPLLALFLSFKLFNFFLDQPHSRFNKSGASLIVTQVMLGLLNILLLAPVFLQIGHLFLSICIWVLFCWKLCWISKLNS